MKIKYILFLLFAFAAEELMALSVTASVSTLDCIATSVTFDFDCNFDGQVIINNPPTGVTFPSLSGPPYIETISGGSITFDVQSSGNANPTFTITFVVLSSNMGCASFNESASVSFNNTCTLPPNDDCVDALPLSISPNSCNYESYTTTNGNVESTFPSCGGDGYHDLWYSFVANNDTVFLEFNALPGTVGYFGLFTDCPAMGGVELDCALIIPGTGISNLEFTGLTVGDDYLVQMLYLSVNAGTDQELCLHSTTPATGCDTNVTVSDAGPNLPNISYEASSVISTSGATNLTMSGIIFDGGGGVELNAGFDTGSFGFEALVVGCTP